MSATQVTIGNTVRRISGMIGRNTSTIIFEEGSVCEHFCSMQGSTIKSITLPDCIKELDEKAFYSCKELKSAKLPASLTTIPKSAFELCTSLESVTIPAGIVTIGEKAFYECKALEKITLPHTVSYIDSEAFRYCDYLEEIHLKSIEPPYLKSYWYEWDQVYYYPFDDCKYLDKIQVPDEGLAAYKADWSKYADIIVGGEPDGKHCETPFATVTTLEATNIGLTEAKLRGSLSMMTEVKDRIIGFLISTDPNNLTTKSYYAFPNGNFCGTQLAADGSFECTCNNLQRGTTYYYRAYAEFNPKLINDQWTGGVVFLGEVKSFTTMSDIGAFSFTTDEAIVGDDLSAILVGSLDFESDGLTLNDADTWVVFNVGESADNLNNEYIATKGPVGESQVGDWIEGTFWTRLSNLEEGKTYYYRAKGYLKSKTLGNTEEVIYGEVKSFVAKKVVSEEPTSYSYTFTQAVFSGNGEAVLGGLVWTLAGNGGHWGYDETKGQQFGSKNNPYKTMTLTSGDVNKVTKIVVNTSGASGTTAKLTVTVGGVQLGSVASLTTTATEYTFTSTEPLSGPAVLSYAHTSDGKAIYIKSITIE